MTRDFLDRLDDAVEGRCACGCNSTITAASPSAWFATENCSTLWHLRKLPGVQELLRRLAEKVRGVVDQVVDAVERFQRLAASVEPCREVLLDVERRPAWPRPLARIDPGQGLAATPLGRPLFRPGRY